METASHNALQYLNGPDQILPATKSSTTNPAEQVKLHIEENEGSAYLPISVPGMLSKTAREYPNNPALAFKRGGHEWQFITFKEYENNVRTCAKAFLKLGLQRYHSVCIMGFNAPEWFYTSLGAIYAGGLSVGLYPTNSEETCLYCAQHCNAEIIVVEDKQQLDKIINIKDKLKNLKAIVQYDGIPQVEGVVSWEQLMKIGCAEPDTRLNNVLKTICINECCSIIFTSGTVGMPKAAMFTHDNITWIATKIIEHFQLNREDRVVSYLPLSHIAAQLLDIYISVKAVMTTYFADKDALKGSLVKTLQEVHPTTFFAVPRVWEKIHENMQKVGRESGMVKAAISSWAKYHGLQHNLNKIKGIESNSFSYLLARSLIFSRVKKAIGLDKCNLFATGAAPLSADIKKYFMSLDMLILEAFGMTECTGSSIFGTIDPYNIDAVGKEIPGTYVKIANPDKEDQGEICFKGRHVFMGYLNDPEKTYEAIDNENWLHTGDIGKIDKNGFLYVTGRLKELVITAGGENISPAPIEEEVRKQLPCISNAMLIGDRRKFLSILLTMKSEVNIETGEPLDELTQEVKQWCRNISCEANTVTEIIQKSNKQFKDAIQKGINEANTKAISNAQRVQKFAILPHDFSIPTGELGPTLKLKRNVVAKKYEDIIESLYQ